MIGTSRPPCGSPALVNTCGCVSGSLRTRSPMCASAAGRGLLWTRPLGEAIRDALEAGLTWAQVGQALGVKADTSVGVAAAVQHFTKLDADEVLGHGRRGDEMKRALMSLAGLYLLFAVIGRFVEGMGAVECGCADDCWCKRPVLSTFRR